MQSLTRLIGSHASLVGMASYLVPSGPSAAFAATTATQDVNLSVDVGSTISLSTVAGPSGMTVIAGNVTAASGTFEVTTNNSPGYNVQIKGTNDTCGKILCSGSDAMPDLAPAYDGTTSTTTNAPAAGSGLMFRLVKTGTVAGLYADAMWGASDAAGTAEFTGIPTAAAQQIGSKGGPASAEQFLLTFQVDTPGTQPSGVYTNGNPIVLTAVTN